MCGDPGISAFPEGDNIFCWKGTISGSKDTVYEGMIYRLSLSFPTDYPFKPPKVKFDSPCFHPNVDVFGNICLDILQDKWSSAYDVRTILISIQSLLGEPNNESPLNTQAAVLWINQQGWSRFFLLGLGKTDLWLFGLFGFYLIWFVANINAGVCLCVFFVMINLCRVQENGGEALQANLNEGS